MTFPNLCFLTFTRVKQLNQDFYFEESVLQKYLYFISEQMSEYCTFATSALWLRQEQKEEEPQKIRTNKMKIF